MYDRNSDNNSPPATITFMLVTVHSGFALRVEMILEMLALFASDRSVKIAASQNNNELNKMM
jgi:hypothetical protein